jgi:hypothetical protein
VLGATWELSAPGELECNAAAQLQRYQERTQSAVGHGINGELQRMVCQTGTTEEDAERRGHTFA